MAPGSKPSAKTTGKPTSDRAHDILRSERHPLDAMFAPRSVAVVGATERPGSIGRNVLWNLLSNPFGGTVFPINPNRSSVLGIKAYPSISAVPEDIELAIITTPAATVPDVVSDCVASGVQAAIVISAGFREYGAEGEELEREILRRLGASRMRIIGPNCLGLMNPLSGLNASWAQTIARPGNVAFISQSGALCTAILDWSLQEMVGFSSFVSIGSMLDVGWGDLIDYFGDDPRTHAIVIYMETIGNARTFLSAAREVSLTKPIIVIKAGRTEAAAKAAASHTGSMVGSDDVLDAAFRRAGVLRVNLVSDLFYMAEVLAKQPRPRGPRLAVLTNAGGPGVLAADALLLTGGQLAELAPETMEEFNNFLPPHWSHNNPVDILGDASPDRFAKALEIVAKDPNTDGMLVITAPQGLTEPTATAELLKPYAKSTGKPVLASFMGGADVRAADEILNRIGIPTFPFPDTAARAFNYMWKYSYNLRGLYETPVAREFHNPDRLNAGQIISGARDQGRTMLTEYESKQLLAAYGIPIVETRIARSEDEAIAVADEMGYPVVLKLYSQTITHKTDVGGVQLNIRNADGARIAWRAIETGVREKVGDGNFLGVTVQPMIKLEGGYELIIGSSIDPQFGPVLLFGSGGQLVEVYKDRALGLPPLNTTLARRMMEQTKIFEALHGVRGRKAVDMRALEELMVRFSQLVVEQRWVKEIDINPLLASPEGLLALDARVVIHNGGLEEDKLPRSVVRPYPTQYVAEWKLKDGTPVTIRPIRPEDEPAMIKFHERLSDRTVYLRYFQPLKLSQRVAHERLTRICFIDYDREMALVVERADPASGEKEILAVGRLSRMHGVNEAECAVLVRDEYQHLGLGKELFRRSLEVARNEKIARVSSTMLAENREMRAICKRLGFELHIDMEDQTVKAWIDFPFSPPAAA
ncbi:MAG TPA: bifunctional acetate--CoA ligase family protein/GNAT family N-acetyltransferase [Terriglobales bacterium]|nr:bifunctional acetate--CoA ligase family protein/GNAT family N-acetyltransferase [Terriglobales bacterium]